ncbi:MAG: hypothetical protein HQ559_02440, partial [Lentisphaerae bacterium]|nr:hypothetical protein [Lentisphaerota bacterium]
MSDKSTPRTDAAEDEQRIDPNEFPSIQQYAFISRDRTTQDFSASNAEVIADTLAQMNGPYALKLLCIARNADFYSSPRFDAFAVLFKSVDILISALRMVCQRQSIEAFALLRLALETAATGLHICKDENAFERYVQVKYKSTRAISFAKGVVPCLGEIWGALSQVSVHANVLTFGPHYSESADGEGMVRNISLSFDVRHAKPVQDETSLTFIALGASIILRLAEEALLDRSGTFPGWLQVPGTGHLYFCKTDERIKKYYDKMATLPLQYQAREKSTASEAGETATARKPQGMTRA